MRYVITTKPNQTKSMRLPVFLCFLFFSILSLAQYQALALDETLTKNANAVLRLDQMEIEIHSKKEMVVKNKQVITVLNRLGNRHARTALGYDSSKKIKAIEIIIYDKLGNQIEKIKKKDFTDVSAVDGFSLYLDYRQLYYDYTPISYPYTLEFNYEYITPDTGSIPSWYFLGGFMKSVEKSRYSIYYANSALKPIIHEKNLESIRFEKKETGSSIVYTAENIGAIKQERLSPTFGKIAPRLMTKINNFHYKGYDGTIESWSAMGTWIDEKLLAGRDELNEATILEVKDLTSGIEDDLEKAKKIYKYVQDNTRYISVQIGIGGLQPISAIEVDRVKYGDCKGLSNYTKALLKAVGVDSYYAVVQAGADKVDFEEDFADLAQGNHVILTIPHKGTYYWIDCTSQVLPFGYIGSFTDDRKVLIVKPEGGELVRTTSYVDDDNYQHIGASYVIDSEGGIAGNATIKTKGVRYYQHFRLNQDPKEDVIKHYKNQWNNINNLKVSEYSLNDDKAEVTFSETVSLNATNYASLSGNRILFTVNAFNNNDFVPDRYRNRKLPFEIQRGFLDTDEFTIELPKEYSIEAMPKERQIETEFGSYEVAYTYVPENNTVKYSRSLLVKKGYYPKEKYSDYRDFRKETARLDDAQIVLVKNQ